MTGAGTPLVRSSRRACRRSAPRAWNGPSPVVEARRVRFQLSRVGELLELDGGLALVVDRVADAEQGGGRVEQAARAGGQRGVHAPGGHRGHGGPLVLVAAGHVPRRGVAQVGRGHPPGLPDRGRAAGHRDGGEVAAALVSGEVGHEELAAPDGAVGAVAGAVEGHPDDRAVLGRVAVVGQAGGDVGVVVLHADQVQALVGVGEFQRVLGGQVLRVQVVRDHLRLDAEQPAEVRDALGERAQRLGVLQVPDVVRDEGVPPLGQAERVLELGAAGQHGAREAARSRRAARGRSRGSGGAAPAGRGRCGPPSRRS